MFITHTFELNENVITACFSIDAEEAEPAVGIFDPSISIYEVAVFNLNEFDRDEDGGLDNWLAIDELVMRIIKKGGWLEDEVVDAFVNEQEENWVQRHND